MTIHIESEWNGRLLRDYLVHSCHFSHHMLKRLKYTPDGIQINGHHVTVRYILHTGDLLELATEDTDTQDADILPKDLPIEIIYEDSDMVVPSKPANMPTHPSHNHHDDTVANALVYRYGKPYCFRPVNRLDRNTSGLLLIARNQVSAELLNRSMRAHRIHKKYIAILQGVLPESEGTISTYIHRTAASIIVREVCGPDDFEAVTAITEYRTLAVSQDGYSIVEAAPITGRTHQLRVHFSYLNCPIVGDDLYGNAHPDINRQALHAHELDLPRPSDGQNIHLVAPIANDMRQFIHKHFSGYDTSVL